MDKKSFSVIVPAVVGLAVTSALLPHRAGAQAPSPSRAGDGAALYRNYCAPCHGSGGRGDGPVASSMRKQPPDLTRLAKQNGGVFPAERIRRIIEGREVSSHGTREMPVWGDVFMAAERGAPAPNARRIDEVLQYLDSLQQKDAQ